MCLLFRTRELTGIVDEDVQLSETSLYEGLRSCNAVVGLQIELQRYREVLVSLAQLSSSSPPVFRLVSNSVYVVFVKMCRGRTLNPPSVGFRSYQGLVASNLRFVKVYFLSMPLHRIAMCAGILADLVSEMRRILFL